MKHSSSNLYKQNKKNKNRGVVVGLKPIKRKKTASLLRQVIPGWTPLLLVQKRRRAYCGAFMSTKQGPDHKMAASRDHVFPRGRYGGILNNIVLCCRECNQNKANKDPTPRQIKWHKKYTLAGIAYALADMHEEAFTKAHKAWHEQKHLDKLNRMKDEKTWKTA